MVSPTSFAKANCAVPAIDGPMLNRDSLTPIYPASLSDCLIQTDPPSDARLTRLPHPGAYVPAVSQGYLSRKLPRPLPTKDGGTLRTVLDARAYMLRLSKDRERSARWQRAAQNYSLRPTTCGAIRLRSARRTFMMVRCDASARPEHPWGRRHHHGRADAP